LACFQLLFAINRLGTVFRPISLDILRLAPSMRI